MKKRHSKADVLRLIQARYKFQIIALNEFTDAKLTAKALEAEMKDSDAVIFVKR